MSKVRVMVGSTLFPYCQLEATADTSKEYPVEVVVKSLLEKLEAGIIAAKCPVLKAQAAEIAASQNKKGGGNPNWKGKTAAVTAPVPVGEIKEKVDKLTEIIGALAKATGEEAKDICKSLTERTGNNGKVYYDLTPGNIGVKQDGTSLDFRGDLLDTAIGKAAERLKVARLGSIPDEEDPPF